MVVCSYNMLHYQQGQSRGRSSSACCCTGIEQNPVPEFSVTINKVTKEGGRTVPYREINCPSSHRSDLQISERDMLRALKSLNGPDQPHLMLPPTPMGPGAQFKLSLEVLVLVSGTVVEE